jgi:SAM-dependent methyltransferase
MSATAHPLYDAKFFQETTAGSFTAARLILERLRKLRPFTSVLDVGCGVGAWLEVAKELGAAKVLGIDGDYVPTEIQLIGGAEFEPRNLEEPLKIPGRFDLALCLELAEHLTPKRGPSLVTELVGATDFIAFSAAIPYQGGDGHVNEMWPTYWASLFAAHGYRPWDGLRREIWTMTQIPWWYRQNLILFVAENSWADILGEEPPTPIADLDAVHPECYLWAARRAKAPFKTEYGKDVSVYQQAAKCSRTPPGYGPEFAAPMLYGRKQP